MTVEEVFLVWWPIVALRWWLSFDWRMSFVKDPRTNWWERYLKVPGMGAMIFNPIYYTLWTVDHWQKWADRKGY